MGQQTYSSGSGTWTVPTGVTSISVICIGGGASAESDDGYPDPVTPSGGAGGGCSYTPAYTVTPGAGISYSVGAGGIYQDTEVGGDTTFGTMTAEGADASPGGASGGTYNYTGGDGGAAGIDFFSHGGAGGGSSAGTDGNGNNGQIYGAGGAGGAAKADGGAGGNGGSSGGNGSNGAAPGGGGGARGSITGGALTGGNGGAGYIQIDWTDPEGGGGGCEDESKDGPFVAAPTGAGSDATNVGGTAVWANSGNLEDDDSSVTSITSSVAETSEGLVTEQYNFNLHLLVPDHIITGIQVDLIGKAVNSGTVKDYRMQLIKGGYGNVGDIKSGGDFETTTTYGGPTDLWGETWDLGDVSTTGFGFVYQAYSTGASSYEIQYATITVYTASGTDACEHKRGYCFSRGNNLEAGKQVTVQVSDDADDGTFTPGYFSDGVVIFGFIGAVP